MNPSLGVRLAGVLRVMTVPLSTLHSPLSDLRVRVAPGTSLAAPEHADVAVLARDSSHSCAPAPHHSR
ncbi:hypothetical protein C5E02_13445 [Rathayibacter rathayi]|uniref:Uncharacterized protein n=1 Tax=Rathayibacter rathayi TaxID=33887 RepID=A0ABX5ACF3_RATRA|nr:hypothetical protein C1O28_13755 [Rathayibacter rathayi]PPF49733.1 hypothetical protein C5C08_06695 [Rathayibacter rathayi]PPG65725.1 hypothetical protein C5C16_12680 [Rathayibacter rathayi]PPG76108.1 hypothetical protein C5C15_11575 [Rathayibacter rathayi]PPH28033.1 hypothetical protein C5C28_15800 [Rathayibacter rathayi]